MAGQDRSIGGARQLQLLGLAEELGDASEEATGRAAIKHTMIEAQRHVGFHHRHELTFRGIPAGLAPRRAHAENEGLLWQGNGRGPGQAEGAEIGDRGDRSASGVRGQLALVRQLDEFVIARDQFFQ